jgi:hypothetical protein
MDQRSWIVIDRLHFHNGPPLRLKASTDIILQNSEISQRERSCLHIFHDSQNILVKQNAIHNCGVKSGGRTKAESGVNGEGIYVGSSSGKRVDRTGFVTLQANEVYNTTDEGINVKENTHNILVENNVVHDLTTSDPGGINLRPVIGDNHIVRGNIVYNIRGHQDTGAKAGTGIVTGKGISVYNNIVYNNQHYGIRVLSGSKVYDNTIYDNGSGAVDVVDKDVDMRNNSGPKVQ